MLGSLSMRLKSGSSSAFRVVLLAWVSMWLLMLPLFHVHPEVEHNHGDPGHAHHAITHSVFSTPLECEFHEPAHNATYSHGSHHEVQSIGHHGHTFNHPEVEFSLAASSYAPTVGKLLLALSYLFAEIPSHTVGICEDTTDRAIAPTIAFLSTALPLRAPPVPLS